MKWIFRTLYGKNLLKSLVNVNLCILFITNNYSHPLNHLNEQSQRKRIKYLLGTTIAFLQLLFFYRKRLNFIKITSKFNMNLY
jgi:hypothetical protein